MSTKYAIVNAFGRQVKVREGDKIQANHFKGDIGSTVTLSEVVLLSTGSETRIGAPLLQGVKVTATVEAHTRGDKVLVFKYLRKNRHKKTQGHRQPYTILNIKAIEG